MNLASISIDIFPTIEFIGVRKLEVSNLVLLLVIKARNGAHGRNWIAEFLTLVYICPYWELVALSIFVYSYCFVFVLDKSLFVCEILNSLTALQQFDSVNLAQILNFLVLISVFSP